MTKVDLYRRDSDLAKQLGVRAVPHFVVYNKQGKKIHEGAKARAYFDRLQKKIWAKTEARRKKKFSKHK